MSKTCLDCGKHLKGRTDKKFCDDYCRNHYNNRLKSKSAYSSYVRTISNSLIKNRRILEGLIPAGEQMTRVSRNKLILSGFQFRYHTHTYVNRKGNTYSFCYDYGYLPLDNEWFLVVRRKEE